MGRARGFKITCSPTAMSWLRERLSISSTSIINLDNAAAVIAADARAGLSACQACSAFSLPGRDLRRTD